MGIKDKKDYQHHHHPECKAELLDIIAKQLLTMLFRVRASRTSSSFPATRNLLHSLLPSILARFGSSTPSDVTAPASKASPSCFMTLVPRPVILSPSSRAFHDFPIFPTADLPRSSDITQDGKFAYFTLTTANHVAALDISNLSNVRRLDDPDSDQPIIGPHYVKVTPDQKHLVVTDYFVQTGDIGVINTPADFKAQYIDILNDGSLSFNRSIDFQREFANRGGAKPHSAVVFDLTDPAHPYYY